MAELNEDPNRFLAAVQVGVTLAGFLSAAFGGATLSGDLTPVLVDWGIPPGVASPLALVLVTPIVLAVSFLAAYIPARRASRVNPMQALRYE